MFGFWGSRSILINFDKLEPRCRLFFSEKIAWVAFTWFLSAFANQKKCSEMKFFFLEKNVSISVQLSSKNSKYERKSQESNFLAFFYNASASFAVPLRAVLEHLFMLA